MIKIKTFPYLPTLKLKNKSETDIFFSWPVTLFALGAHIEKEMIISEMIFEI